MKVMIPYMCNIKQAHIKEILYQKTSLKIK